MKSTARGSAWGSSCRPVMSATTRAARPFTTRPLMTCAVSGSPFCRAYHGTRLGRCGSVPTSTRGPRARIKNPPPPACPWQRSAYVTGNNQCRCGCRETDCVARGQKVLLDSDLAELYGVSTKRLNEAVKRNPDRFPEDFAFRLSVGEVAILKSQTATSKFGRGRRRRSLPRAFMSMARARPRAS